MPVISRRKQLYPVTASLRQYLYRFDRQSDIPLVYNDLCRFSGSIPYEDPSGRETLWLTVMYPPEVMAELGPQLTKIYANLKIGGESDLHKHLTVDRIDFGEFGNSRPFRIRVTNLFNDNSDYYYVKTADSSRIYGLEIEHILSPNRINYLVNGNTLIEEHIAGLPGSVFNRDYLDRSDFNPVRIAKEFVKFNERCFIRLLGDMRSANYVVDITPDFEEIQYRVRPIDFDQQSYQGRAAIYHAYRFRDNHAVTRLAFDVLHRRVIAQYIEEERSQMARRARVEQQRLRALFSVMKRDEIAPMAHVLTLKEDLRRAHHTERFDECKNMGELTAEHILLMLETN